MLWESRSANKGARCSALRSRSRAESSLGATMLTPHSSLAVHALDRPGDRLLAARPHHLAPFVARGKEALLDVGLDRLADRRLEVAALMPPVVGAPRARHL